MLWIDSPDAEGILTAKIESLSINLNYEKPIRDLIQNGVAVCKDIISSDTCADAIFEIEKFKAKTKAGNRIVNLHIESRPALDIACSDYILGVIGACFGVEAVAYTSLSFFRGSEQQAHRDCPHFTTYPQKDCFFGAWTALQDVSASNGSIFYIKNGHRLTMPTGGDIAMKLYGKDENLTRDQVIACQNEYEALLLDKVDGMEKLVIEASAGDVIIWHPLMPHGGSPILNPSSTRYSMVTHCIPMDYQVGNASAYYDHEQYIPPAPYKYKMHAMRKYVEQPKPFHQTEYV